MATQKIYVAGHRGMVGSAIVRSLRQRGVTNLLLPDRAKLDLLDQSSVMKFMSEQRPDQIYLAAARVGGIHANSTYPADFIYENLMIEANVIHAAFRAGVKQLLFLGSSCIYPKFAPQPISEKDLLTGALEETNEPYALAKIAGISLCDSFNRQYGAEQGIDYRCVMPTNLYGPGDDYHPENSHVIPGLIRRFHEAQQNAAPSVKVWGTGTPRREFLYVDDLADACIHVMSIQKSIFDQQTAGVRGIVNVGFGADVTIAELARLVAKVVAYKGIIEFDITRPDGTPQKLLDSTLANALGWSARTELEAGLYKAYEAFLKARNVSK